MEQAELQKGKFYYYAKDPKRMECLSVGEESSEFVDGNKRMYKFYNKDIYLTKYKQPTR